MKRVIRIGTRESRLAVWQAKQVEQLLQQQGHSTQIILIKSEGDIDLKTPLYEMGVEGVFTRYLDAALINERVDVAVHSMKDVPTIPAKGIVQAAVLKRGSFSDLLVYKNDIDFLNDKNYTATIATGSLRRKAQWLHRYPDHRIENLRGNVNTRLRKIGENDWNGAIFAAAGLERIHLRPENSIDLGWMLPAPAQGAITISCRENDDISLSAASLLNDEATQICTKIERDFLRTLLGGCSTPISALAVFENNKVVFKGNVCSVDGKEKFDIYKEAEVKNYNDLGVNAAEELLKNERAREIIYEIRNAK